MNRLYPHQAVLIDDSHQVRGCELLRWENQQVDIWTYPLEQAWEVASAYLDLKSSGEKDYGVTLTRLQAMGFSAMMAAICPLTTRTGCSPHFAPGATP